MPTSSAKFFAVLLLTVFTATGCATTKARRPDPNADLNNQVAQLQNEVQAKDQQIQELQGQVESYQRSLDNSSNFSSSRGGRSSIITASGVSVSDVQRALIRAGYDPGPVDGRIGRKTKTAIKKFQSAHGLSADGVVGKRTWSLLNQ